MTTSKRSGGIGRKILYQPTGEAVIAYITDGQPQETTIAEQPQAVEEIEEDSKQNKEPEKPKIVKARTTVMLYPATLAALDQLKAELRKSGEKVTYSDVLEQAIWALMEKNGLNT